MTRFSINNTFSWTFVGRNQTVFLPGLSSKKRQNQNVYTNKTNCNCFLQFRDSFKNIAILMIGIIFITVSEFVWKTQNIFPENKSKWQIIIASVAINAKTSISS